jgi:isoquinoline 1-oxidoreductase beta subunit
VIGQPTRQLQVRDIVTGKMRYTQDVKVPGAVATVVARPPTINGNVVAVDSSAAEAMEGVIAVTQIPSGVAVSATTFHHAMKARDALVITWAPGPMAGMSDAEIRQQLAAAAPDMPPPLPSAEYVEGTFQFNFTPHNLMEVFDAVADVRSDGADIWVGTQFPQGVQAQVAAAIGMTPESVTVHHLRSGGGFGGRIFALAEIEAAQVSQAIGKPVKLMWSRPDVVRHGHMRGASYHQIRVLLSQGIVWDHYATSVDFNIPAQASPFVASSILPMQTYISMPYDVGQFVARSSTHALAMHTTPYRAPMSYPVATAREVMVDEAAAALGQDPVAFRRSLIKTDRGIAVLDKVAQTGNWGRAMPRGCAQGVAYHEEYGSLMAALVEIDATDPQAPRVTKLLIVVDAGLPANPLGIASQVMGGAQNGMAEVLQAGVHIDDGAVREHTFGDVMWTRQRNHPLESECHIMPRNGEPGGCGEVGPCVASGATANAYARATGTKPRNFPIINF